jgi:hypothetical protein
VVKLEPVIRTAKQRVTIRVIYLPAGACSLMLRPNRLQEAHDLDVLQTALETSRADEVSASNETAQVRLSWP